MTFLPSGRRPDLPRTPITRSDGAFTVSPLPTSDSPLEPQSNPGRARRKRKMSVTRKGEEWEDRNCRLRAIQLRVQDLGLGYQSDEIVLFKYCSGNCPLARTNHDLTLSLLLRKTGLLNTSQKIVSDPCCRPTQFKDVTFLDINNRWHTVEKLSASECSCIG
ncbi:artemin-like [Stegostoma tigrinum]|uniref:artemin-like n=1 Tax=Stegostoma tigrinum TaxID=3053191 RepID=UPI0028705744|nr:artemin-like [Stegostoma tigrinum]